MHNVHIKTMFGQDTLHIVPDAREGEGGGGVVVTLRWTSIPSNIQGKRGWGRNAASGLMLLNQQQGIFK